MKKLISVLCVAMAMLILTACGKFTCENCNQEKSGSKHKITLLNQSATICDDCYEQMKAFGLVD